MNRNNMKIFELAYNFSRFFLPPLSLFVHKKARKLVVERAGNVAFLDVGGRKSHHTINIPAEVTVTDIPRESDVQTNLDLGVNDQMIEQLLTRRSNIKKFVIDDMVDTKLPGESFDVVMAIEVLEHVVEDEKFVSNVCKILKQGGVFFMTTPNGDHVPNDNPDHVRHYTRGGLLEVMRKSFEKVEVNYVIYESKSYFRSLNSWSVKHPLRTITAMGCSLFCNYQSKYLKNTARNSRHLAVVAVKN